MQYVLVVLFYQGEQYQCWDIVVVGVDGCSGVNVGLGVFVDLDEWVFY